MVTVIIVDPACKAWPQDMQQHDSNGILLMDTTVKSNLPVFTNKKMIAGNKAIYVYHQGICQEPTHSVQEVSTQIALIN